jgi:ABC-type enterobactin transport system permease subunit
MSVEYLARSFAASASMNDIPWKQVLVLVAILVVISFCAFRLRESKRKSGTGSDIAAPFGVDSPFKL